MTFMRFMCICTSDPPPPLHLMTLLWFFPPLNTSSYQFILSTQNTHPLLEDDSLSTVTPYSFIDRYQCFGWMGAGIFHILKVFFSIICNFQSVVKKSTHLSGQGLNSGPFKWESIVFPRCQDFLLKDVLNLSIGIREIYILYHQPTFLFSHGLFCKAELGSCEVQCSLLKIKWRFRRKYHPHLQAWKISQVRNQQEAIGLFIDPDDEGDIFLWNVSWFFNRLCSVMSQKMELVMKFGMWFHIMW